MDSSTPTSETIENANMFTLEYAFTYGSGKSDFEEKISTTVNQKKKEKKIKSSSKDYVMRIRFKF